MTKEEFLYGQANIRVQREESVSSQVMNCASTPGLPYVNVQSSKHLEKYGIKNLIEVDRYMGIYETVR